MWFSKFTPKNLIRNAGSIKVGYTEEMDRVLKVASLLTFLSYKPYLRNDLTIGEQRYISNFFKKKGDCIEPFDAFVSYDLDINLFSINFVNYYDIHNRYGVDYSVAYDDFLNQDFFKTDMVSDLHKKRFRDTLVTLMQSEVDIFSVVHKSKREVVYFAIDTYLSFFSYRVQRSPKINWKILLFIFVAVAVFWAGL